MGTVPTMTVYYKDNKNLGPVEINVSDFDPEKHSKTRMVLETKKTFKKDKNKE